LGVGPCRHIKPDHDHEHSGPSVEIVSVDGNKVVVKGKEGFREITVATTSASWMAGRWVCGN
jgi:hypothetical protein